MGRVVLVMAVVVILASGCASRSSNPGGSVTAQPEATGLATLIPGDLDVSTDCASSKDPTPKGVTGLIGQLNCVAGPGSAIAGGYLDAYLFASLGALQASFTAMNTTYNFFPSSAGPKCPPKAATAEGMLTWHTGDALGTLECYSTSDGGHVYIWTNEPDRAMFFAKVGKAISFPKLHLWWTRTGCCK